MSFMLMMMNESVTCSGINFACFARLCPEFRKIGLSRLPRSCSQYSFGGNGIVALFDIYALDKNANIDNVPAAEMLGYVN